MRRKLCHGHILAELAGGAWARRGNPMDADADADHPASNENPEGEGDERITGKATLGCNDPRRVLICGHLPWGRAIESTALVDPGPGVVVAKARSAALAGWLVAAINAILDGESPPPDRPPGGLERRGSFTASAGDDFEPGPYVGARTSEGIRVGAARATDAEEARELARPTGRAAGAGGGPDEA
jgi:hypothetical protein